MGDRHIPTSSHSQDQAFPETDTQLHVLLVAADILQDPPQRIPATSCRSGAVVHLLAANGTKVTVLAAKSFCLGLFPSRDEQKYFWRHTKSCLFLLVRACRITVQLLNQLLNQLPRHCWPLSLNVLFFATRQVPVTLKMSTKEDMSTGLLTHVIQVRHMVWWLHVQLHNVFYLMPSHKV
jgi:hypothetical protein